MQTVIKTLLLSMTLLGFITYLSAQVELENSLSDPCGTMNYHEHQLKADPNLAINAEAIERFTSRVAKQSQSRSTHGIITIPVVFHVIYNDEATNISKAQILSQINVLNEDFRNRNEDGGNTPDIFKEVEADVEIEFCLANIDPNGYQTEGITRTPTYHSDFDINFVGFNIMKFDALGGKDAWPSDQYLNIWVVRMLGGGFDPFGYAQFPGGPPQTDGVVIDYRHVGTVGQVPDYPIFNGSITTHEVGHWLNLRHVHGDGDCNASDFVDDTPSQNRRPIGVPTACNSTSINTCIEEENDLPDMFMNYMDITLPHCYSIFTKGQKARMRALFEPGGARESLLYSNGCSSGLSLAFAPRPKCNDGVRNGKEEGIDCGGDCPTCPSIPNYCISGSDLPGSEWIESVSISGSDIVTFNNTSEVDIPFGDYTDQVIQLTPGNEYQIDLVPNFGNAQFPVQWKAFIDYNNDFDFEDVGEEIYNSGVPIFDTQVPNIGIVQGKFRVPDNAVGSARLRIVLKIVLPGLDFTPAEACGIYLVGETEEYTVSFFKCNAPENVSARAVGDDLIVNWDPVLSASAYKIRYAQGGKWHTAICPGTEFRLKNAPMGSYIFQVYAKCGGGHSMGSKQVNISIGGGRSFGHRITDITTNSLPNNLGILQLFPNPTRNNITISYVAQSDQVAIQVKDILGRTLYNRQEVTSSTQMTTLEVSQLPNGIYYLSLYDGETLVTKKFVKE